MNKIFKKLLFKFSSRYLSDKDLDDIQYSRSQERFTLEQKIKKQAKIDILKFLDDMGSGFKKELLQQAFIGYPLGNQQDFIEYPLGNQLGNNTLLPSFIIKTKNTNAK